MDGKAATLLIFVPVCERMTRNLFLLSNLETFNNLGQISDSSDNAVNALMLMANGILTGNDDLENQNDKNEVIKTKSVDFEGRGTVACHLCKKSFILKTLLKRHYITCHSYDPQCPSAITSSPDSKFCKGGVISEGIFNLVSSLNK